MHIRGKLTDVVRSEALISFICAIPLDDPPYPLPSNLPPFQSQYQIVIDPPRQ